MNVQVNERYAGTFGQYDPVLHTVRAKKAGDPPFSVPDDVAAKKIKEGVLVRADGSEAPVLVPEMPEAEDPVPFPEIPEAEDPVPFPEMPEAEDPASTVDVPVLEAETAVMEDPEEKTSRRKKSTRK